MLSNFQLVRLFHGAFGIKSEYKPAWPDPETVRLRLRLLQEEHLELMAALENREPLTNIAKEMADVLFTVYGTAASFGINMDLVMVKVFESNMSKTPDVDGGKAVKGPNYKAPDLSRLA
jgi:predicted HAD superfamily Cof-like phosphohydrolase